MVDMDGMSMVEVPQTPTVVTQNDLDMLQELKEKHEKELKAYEEETRKQRRELRNLKKDTGKKNRIDSVSEPARENIDPNLEREDSKRIAEESARMEAERIQDEAFKSERSKLEDELKNLRMQRKKHEEALSQGTFAKCTEEVESVSSAEDGRSLIPSSAPSVAVSAAPSVASSANPSRSNSPTGSDTCGRSQLLPVGSLAAVVAVTGGTGSGAAPVAVAVAVPAESSPRDPEGTTLEKKDDAPTSGPSGVPGKGSGKGKGKGKAAPLPAPAGGWITPRMRQEQNKQRPNKYVNLRWTVSQEPEIVDEQALANDPFIGKLRDQLHDTKAHSALLEAFPNIDFPSFPSKIFDSSVCPNMQEFPEEMLEKYFKRSEAVVKLPQVENTPVQKAKNFLDSKRLQMVGLMLQKHVMEHKVESNREAVLNIKRGVLRCDGQIVKLEDLSVIRTVLRHVKPGSALFEHVETHGVDAIWDLEYPEHHYLVHELRKVPQVDERLDCMLFQWEFCENMKKYIDNLKTLTKALDALQAKKDLIRRFFVTAHRLGQSLSQKPSRGFQLSTLEQLTRTKSTKMPHLSILHFVLALMSREDAEELFSNEDIALLRNAKALSTAKVCDDCRELAQGLYGVKSIYESGEYTPQSGQAVKIERRRKTLPPQAAASAASARMEPVIDTDDRFHEVMKDFVDTHVDEADDIVVECHKMLLNYKGLALFFDDLRNVYPPPKDPNDKKLDLVDVFYRFAKEVPQHRQQVEEEGLRDLVVQK